MSKEERAVVGIEGKGEVVLWVGGRGLRREEGVGGWLLLVVVLVRLVFEEEVWSWGRMVLLRLGCWDCCFEGGSGA